MECRRGDERTHGNRTIAFTGCQFQALDGRTYTQLDGTDIINIVQFQQGKRLAVTLHQIAGLVCQESVGTATERGHLHTLDTVVLHRSPFYRFQDSVDISPLRKNVSIIHFDVFTAHNVIGQDVYAHACRQIRQFMLYQRVCMVGASDQQNGKAVIVAAVLQHVAVIFGHCRIELLQCIHRFTESLPANRITDAKLFQVGLALLEQQMPVFKCDGGRINGSPLVLHALDYFRIS